MGQPVQHVSSRVRRRGADSDDFRAVNRYRTDATDPRFITDSRRVSRANDAHPEFTFLFDVEQRQGRILPFVDRNANNLRERA